MGRFDDFKNSFGKSMSEGEAMDKKLQEDRDKMAFKYDTGNKITPMSLMDQFTGAPTRAGVAELQKGLGADNFKSAYHKAIEAMSQDPSLAPSGLDIAKGTGVDPNTTGGKALGVGYDLALDPTNLIPSKGSMAAMGAMGKIADIAKMEKGAQALKDVERVKGVLGANKAREMSNVAGIERNVKSAEELVKEANLMPRTADEQKYGRVMQLGELKKSQPGAETLAKVDTMRSTAINNRDPLMDMNAPKKEALTQYLTEMGATPEQIMAAFKKKGL